MRSKRWRCTWSSDTGRCWRACTLSGVIAGLAPALQTSRASAAETMREGAWAIGDGRLDVRRGLIASDPLPFAAVALTLLFAALVACFVPARRAAAVDPMAALRQN